MRKTWVRIDGPGSISVLTGEQAPPERDQVLVKTIVSAISPGTELKFFRGDFSPGCGTFTEEDPIGQRNCYPFLIGYSTVGEIIGAGSSHNDLVGRKVFAYVPHQSSFISRPSDLVFLSDDADPRRFIFTANMETAFNLIMDGRPMMGEEVLILGQGVVGLLLTRLLSEYPLANITTVETHPERRKKSLEMGAHISITPEDLDPAISRCQGFDLVYEVTGNTDAINTAVKYCGFSARLVIGSYYGDKKGLVKLGDDFHRKRIRIISSQVSTIDPTLSGRWTMNRRLKTVMDMISRVEPERLISHEFHIDDAVSAYELLQGKKGGYLQIILTYGD
jgi:2-desacetyl-2-hydroxyethyl bacteriochlorophyllide A dehydrogenase